MKHQIKIKTRGMKESIVEIVFFPQTDKERLLLNGAKKAELSEEEHEQFNNLLIGICLNNNLTPIDSAGNEGNSFFFRVLN